MRGGLLGEGLRLLGNGRLSLLLPVEGLRARRGAQSPTSSRLSRRTRSRGDAGRRLTEGRRRGRSAVGMRRAPSGLSRRRRRLPGLERRGAGPADSGTRALVGPAELGELRLLAGRTEFALLREEARLR